jgi:hypothetical protein
MKWKIKGGLSMDFSKFGGLGNLAALASLGGNGKGSNNYIIWALLAVLVFGFGKGRSVLETTIFQFGKVPDNRHRSRRHYKGALPATAAPLMGFGSFGQGSINSFLGGNGLFIIIVIALLFISKDKVEEESSDIYREPEEISIG